MQQPDPWKRDMINICARCGGDLRRGDWRWRPGYEQEPDYDNPGNCPDCGLPYTNREEILK